jgi:hypothetical protein
MNDLLVASEWWTHGKKIAASAHGADLAWRATIMDKAIIDFTSHKVANLLMHAYEPPRAAVARQNGTVIIGYYRCQAFGSINA